MDTTRTLLSVALLLAVAGCHQLDVHEVTARRFAVQRVVDGDTFRIRYDGDETSIRLAGIDAPELRKLGGLEARAGLVELVGGKTIRIEFTGDRKRDSFGRLLCRVWVGDLDVGAELIRRGLAVEYRR